MYRVLCLLMLAATTGCYSNQSVEETDQVAVAAPAENLDSPEERNSNMETRQDISWETVEIFDFSSAKVNKTMPLYATRQQFENAWGKPDSLSTPDYDAVCAAQFDDEFEYIYAHSSRFERCRDSVVCDLFNFQPGNTMTSGKITLSAATTWQDAKKLFPMAVQQAENEGRTDVITLRDAKESDAGIRLQFRDGKLVSISYNLPC